MLSNAVALVATCKDPNGLHVTLRRAGKYIKQLLCLMAHTRRGKRQRLKEKPGSISVWFGDLSDGPI